MTKYQQSEWAVEMWIFVDEMSIMGHKFLVDFNIFILILLKTEDVILTR